ncbi:hypothetical protein GQ55_6G154600 [Panicum hallii var. hallii]|uniref:Uncharacterized protein n=1 Tax=Panicum hallii var. hallii TaxID=1504633 RepID=A0A2T7D6F4_9POAL|nr:hypothetical protein GQ55_6G154600 [Panicum hallii var. hallii]
MSWRNVLTTQEKVIQKQGPQVKTKKQKWGPELFVDRPRRNTGDNRTIIQKAVKFKSYKNLEAPTKGTGQNLDGGENTGQEANQHNEELATSVCGWRLGHTGPSAGRVANQGGVAPTLDGSKTGELARLEFVGGEYAKFGSISWGSALHNVPLTETGDRSASTIPIPPIGVANFFIPEFVISAELSGRALNTLL